MTKQTPFPTRIARLVMPASNGPPVVRRDEARLIRKSRASGCRWYKVSVAAFLWFALACSWTALSAAELSVDLAGPWRFRLDVDDAGIQQRWFATDLPDRIQLPGSLQAQGYGNDPAVDTSWTGDIIDRSWFDDPQYEKYRQGGNVKVTFWLQPDKHYVGPAWYQRTIDVPAEFAGQRIVLHLERPHWTTRVWLDEREAGAGDSLSTPHELELSGVEPGPHRLTVRVDNRLHVNVGPNSHSVSDHTQTNWNGIVGAIRLRAEPRDVRIDDVQVYPDVKRKTAKIAVTYVNATGQQVSGQITATAACGDHQPPPVSREVRLSPPGGQIEWELPLGDDARLWDEFSPQIYDLTVSLQANGASHRRVVQFGLREFSAQGTQFALNGRIVMLRGTLECCIFPQTGYPPTDLASWQRIYRILKAHGLNHLRFHSWCPPEAAFAAADQAGVLLYVECSTWANQGASVGDGKPLDDWLKVEADRILRRYGNHPSFVLMSYGNEPAGRQQQRFLGDLVNAWKARDPRRLYTSAAGWPLIPENQWHCTPAPRIHAWGAGLQDRLNALPPATTADYRDDVQKYDVPVVSHEIGQWCVYPDFDEIAEYTGVVKAKNLEVFRDSLQANHLGDRARDFLMASGKLQTLCYKEEIESALRTPGMGGFELLDLHDFPGQGSALVGVLDPFWDSKPYVTPEAYHRFACQTVPLARLAKRIWTTGEEFTSDIEIAHFGPRELASPRIIWSLTDSAGNKIGSGDWQPETLPTGKLSVLGRIACPLRDVAAPARLVLEVAVEGTGFANDWDVWAYPPSVDIAPPPDVLVVASLDEAAAKHLQAGGNVLLLPAAGTVKGDRYGKIPAGFSSIFWNTAWTRRQAPHTLGIVCDPKHPALAAFPTEYHSNWQWWDLVTKSQAMILNDLPPNLQPVVSIVDDWFTNRRLGLVVEARVGAGRLLMCSIDLSRDLESRPVARQLRHSLMKYLASDAFRPSVAVDLTVLQQLFQPPSTLQKLGATVRASSDQPEYPAVQAIDGDPATIWHTPWGDGAPGFPHELILDLQTMTPLAGIRYLPRQDMANGWISQYEIQLSDDGRQWRPAVAQGVWKTDRREKVIPFTPPQSARFVRLKATAGHEGKPFAAIAELDVLVP